MKPFVALAVKSDKLPQVMSLESAISGQRTSMFEHFERSGAVELPESRV